MAHGYLVVSKINKTTGCDVLALHIKARRFMRRALSSCFMHVVVAKPLRTFARHALAKQKSALMLARNASEPGTTMHPDP
ncbi:hypothetical protein [Mesorhizobium sp. STM 4661]|uniref:hypothetical protein n=1 Tax=Mesorhizobium sp. STM 4661 TaxID=1297570 RepID=UPI0012FCE172|nr:hypothetical protein [Mesorhizobium sp. STM 4661]